jgi:hypothetical protein
MAWLHVAKFKTELIPKNPSRYSGQALAPLEKGGIGSNSKSRFRFCPERAYLLFFKLKTGLNFPFSLPQNHLIFYRIKGPVATFPS